FIQAHDPDFVPELVYPEYIRLEDEHVLSAEEQPLPPVDSPTVESPGYVAESDLEEDPKYEDDKEQDGPVDYPIGEGDDGGDDDNDSSRDDAADKDEDIEEEEEDEEEEEEEEYLAPADSDMVIPTVRLVSPPEGTEPVIPPPFTDTTTIGARITFWFQAAISFHQRQSPICMSITTTYTITITSIIWVSNLNPDTQALIDAVTTTLPSPPLPPPIYISPPVDSRDEIPEINMPPRKRLYLSTLGSRYKVKESSNARPTGGRGIDYGFVSTLDAKARRRGIGEVGYGIRDTWPVALPSPDYILGPEEPQTPSVPQVEDECEPVLIQPHDPDYVP
nr:hypothetical protein [Tanacetum cinerariifolium]